MNKPAYIPVVLLLGLLLGCLTSPSLAAAREKPLALWPAHGIAVNDTPGNAPQQSPQMVSDGYGGYIIAWEDGRSGYYDIYAQKINESGQLIWPKDGVAACTASGNQNSPVIASDQAGGIIVAWQDFRNGNADIYVQRLSYAGKALWGKGGLAICTAPAGQLAPAIVADGAGGAIITWHDYRSGKGEDVYAQKINLDGQIQWAKDGLAVCSVKGTQWYPQLASDDRGGAVIAWSDGRSGSANNDIFAQYINASGQAVWQADGLPVCSAEHNQETPRIIAVKDGVIIAWHDSRSKNIDIYAQKLALNGTVLWTKDGVPVSTYPYTQEDLRLVADGSGGAIVVWTDSRAEQSDIYAQRLYSNGSIAWSENGRPVCQALGDQKNPVITKLLTDDWLVVWQDDLGGKLKTELYAQKINSSGTPLWQPRGLPVVSAKGEQSAPALATTPKGNVILAWQDSRTGNADIQAQKLSTAGQLLWTKAGVIVCQALGSVVQQNVCLTLNNRDEIILAFEDARSGFFNIYAQKLSKAGVLTWGKDGLPVAKVAANQTKPCLVADNKGGAIFAWEDLRIEGRPMVRAQRLNRQGVKVWESSLAVALAKGAQTDPLLVSDGHGGAIIAWTDQRDVLSLQDIYAQRLSSKGQRLWGKAGKIVISANGEQVDADMISDGQGGIIITWTDFRRGDRNPDIYAQHLDGQGQALWPKNGVLICGAPDVQRSPKIISDGQGGAIISWTDKGGGSYDIYAQRIDQSGKTVWMSDGIPINQLSRTQQNALFGNNNILVFEDYRYGNWDIFAAAVSLDGKLTWPEAGVPVVLIPLTQYAPQIIPWKKGSVIIAWEDYRSGKHYEVFIQRLDAAGEMRWQENGLKVGSRDGGRSAKLLADPKNDSFYVFWEDYTNGGKAIYGQRYLLY